MPRRYLFGPVSAEFAANYLRGPREDGTCLAFGPQEGTDLTLSPADSFNDLLRRLPDGWDPDFIVVRLAYTRVPPAVWDASVPIVTLAPDWNLLWHRLRLALPHCDLILTDTPGAEALARHGFPHARAANLSGLGRDFLEAAMPDQPRDLDVLFVGNLNPAVQCERLPWLARLARLAPRRRVAIRTGVFGEDYRRLLRSARIVFNRSNRRECNRRVFQTIWGSALLFQEAENREVPQLLRDRHECVLYSDENLEDLLRHYLDREDERSRVAGNAHRRLEEFSFEALWAQALQQVETAWPTLLERAEKRRGGAAFSANLPHKPRHWLLPAWEGMAHDSTLDEEFFQELEAEATGERAAELHNAMGVLRPRSSRGVQSPGAMRVAASRHFEQAIEADPTHLVARLNHVEVLTATADGQAREETQRLLALVEEPILSGTGPAWLDAPHWLPAFDWFRIEWERAASENAGRPQQETDAKRRLIRCRLHFLLGDLTGDWRHCEEAASLRPHLSVLHVALGCALARNGRLAEAVTSLRRGLAGNPFDRDAARALFESRRNKGETGAAEELAAQRRLLAAVAPQLVPVEPWFSLPPDANQVGSPLGSPASPNGRPRHLRLETFSLDQLAHRFGVLDTTRAVCGFTPPRDTHAVLTLLAHARARRILEIGTAVGHMTANLTEWSPDDALVFTIGTLDEATGTGDPRQHHEAPTRAGFGRFADHFGKAHKVLFITADSLRYDFRRLAPFDFAFIDGAHDLEHVLCDSRKVYDSLRPGGCLVWHDFGANAPWVQVREAIERFGPEETVCHVTGTTVAFLHKSQTSVAAADPTDRKAVNGVVRGDSPPLAITWHGDVNALHSLALVNREVCARLVAAGHDVSILPLGVPPGSGVPEMPEHPALAGRTGCRLPRAADVCVRHGWPPDFTAPSEGRWVVIQPWEFGRLPRAWVPPLVEQVDEVWAYTRAVRDCFIESGMPADRVHLMPLGVDPGCFRPDTPPLRLRTERRFRFLFVGGTIARKGFDILLTAYGSAFSASDDVCLVVKDMGVGTFYRGQTGEGMIAQLRARPNAPEVEYLDGSLRPEEMAGLYTACDCLVHPYRGEGFGLPIAEAMASGLPVIVTGLGAACDYCDESTGYMIPAAVAYLPENRVGSWETVGRPWLAEPDLKSLAHLMRRVNENPREARAKGAAGCLRIRERFTWDLAVAAIQHRMRELCHQSPRRHSR